MNTKNIAIAGIAIVLLILLGAAGYLMLNKNTATTNKTATTQNQTAGKNEQTRKSLLDLIKMGQNLRCTFKSEVANGTTEGTVYVSGQDMRADFIVKTTSDGKTIETSMIKIGDTSYVWGAGLPTGIKMKVALDKLAESKQASQYVDPNQKIDYNCAPWNVDSSLLSVPKNIEFTDMSSLLAPKETQAAKEESPATTTTTNPCSQITDPSIKAACESALQKANQ